MNQRFKGVIPPLTTPFSEDGRILYDSLRRNVERYLGSPVSGLLFLGSNGEATHLNSRERLELIDKVEHAIPAERKLLVGLNAATLRDAYSFLEAVAGRRIDALLVATPNYYRNRMNRQALLRFFVDLADRSPFPLLLYNVPQYSGIELSAELVAELADHEAVVGMKDSSGNLMYVQRILEATRRKDFQLILGSAQILGPALALGIDSAILAVACAFPHLPVRVMEAFGEGEDILELQLELFRVANAVTVFYGVPGLKYAMDLAGFEGKECRRPLLPLTEEEKEAVCGALRSTLVGQGLDASVRADDPGAAADRV